MNYGKRLYASSMGSFGYKQQALLFFRHVVKLSPRVATPLMFKQLSYVKIYNRVLGPH